MSFKPTKEQWLIAAGWVVFMFLFWFLGAEKSMGKTTAFFGIIPLTAVYAVLVIFIKKILPIGTVKR